MEPLVKPHLEFQKIYIKYRQNGKKCDKIAIKTQKFAKNYKKNCQKWQWNTKNILQFDPFSCWQPEVYPTYLVSTQKWPKNSQKKGKNGEKIKKIAKKGWFCTAKFAQKEMSFAIFFQCISLACLRRAIWTPKVLSETLFSWRYVWHNIAPFYNISQKSNFFTDQDMIEAIAQNWAKTKGSRKKK